MPHLTRLFLALLLTALSALAQAPARPNILLILADDLGYSDLGCFGAEIATPHLDKLAAGGLRFTQFYNIGRCCPSRASLMSGLYPHQVGVGDMVDSYAQATREKLNSPAYSDHLSLRSVTIAEALRPAGYRTYMCGKWHLGYRPEEWPVRRGFDRSFVQIDGAMNYFGRGIQHTPNEIPPMALDDKPWEPPADGFYSTDAYARQAVQFIRENGAKQLFFLYLAFNAPHWPLQAPAEDIQRYQGKYADGWQAIRSARFKRQIQLGVVQERWGMAPPDRGNNKPWDQLTDAQRQDWADRMSVYAAMVERMDRGIGAVLEELRKQGMENNTLVLFLSDNGGAAENPNRSKSGAVLGSRDSYVGYGRPWATVSNTPLRLHKQTAHEGGISGPAIAYWPGVIAQPGSITHHPAHLVDVMATCLQITGATYPAERAGQPLPLAEGVSLMAAFKGQTLPERTLCWEHEGHRAVRQGKWKLVARRGDPWELYDIDADRAELKDLSATQPERVKELDAKYQAWAQRCGVLPWPGKGK